MESCLVFFEGSVVVMDIYKRIRGFRVSID